jgi:hypothetical protein
MTFKFQNDIEDLIGLKCCRIRVWTYESLSLGFGKKIKHNNPKLIDKYYGEWEIGTYHCSWRIMDQKKILLGSDEPAKTTINIDHINELNRIANTIKFGRITSITNQSRFDVHVDFDSGISIDFFACAKYKDELFHIFCPDNKSISLQWNGKWKIEPSSF